MARVGRNAPCPCGSGKKYKKCCQKSDEAAARDRHDDSDAVQGPVFGGVESRERKRPPPRGRAGGNPLGNRATVAYLEAVDRILRTASRVHNQWIKRHSISFLGALLDDLFIDSDELDDTEIGFLQVASVVLPGVPVHLYNPLIAEIRKRLSAPDGRFFDTLCRTPLQAWCVHGDGRGRVESGHPLFGPDKGQRVTVSRVIDQRLHGPGRYVGWPVTYQGIRILAFAQPLDADQVELIQDAVDEVQELLEVDDSDQFWRALEPDLVSAAVGLVFDRDQEDDPEDPFGLFATPRLLSSLDSGRVLALILSRMRNDRPPWPIVLAQGRGSEAVQGLVERVNTVRHGILSYLLYGAPPDTQSVESFLPLDAVLERFGVTSDGALCDGPGDGNLLPAAVLGVPPAALERLGVDPMLPVASAVRAAEDAPERSESAAILEAARTLEGEQRWLAFEAAWRRDNEGISVGARYSRQIEAFMAIFDGDVLEEPLDHIGLESRTLQRLRSGWLSQGRAPLDAVGDLPQTLGVLVKTPGVGKVTWERLTDALWSHAHEWRTLRARLHPNRARPIAERAPEAVVDLTEGLEELSALMGDLFETG